MTGHQRVTALLMFATAFACQRDQTGIEIAWVTAENAAQYLK